MNNYKLDVRTNLFSKDYDFIRSISAFFIGLILVVFGFSLVNFSVVVSLSFFLLLTITLWFISKQILIYFFLTLFVFSNIVISVYSVSIDGSFSFKVLQGIDFFVAFLVYVLIKLSNSLKFKKIELVLIVVLFSYFIFGSFTTSLTDSAIYLRLFLYPIILYAIGSQFSSYINFNFLISLGVLGAIVSLIEFLSPRLWYELVNAHYFYQFKFPEKNISDIEEVMEFTNRRFFNTNLLDDFGLIVRPGGLIFHPISSAYFMAVCFSIALIYKRYFLSIFMLFGVMVSGSKGAMVAILFIAFFEILRISGFKYRALFPLVLAIVYVMLAYVLSLISKDPHVYSLTASVFNIPNNIVGNGLGWGGSITSENLHVLSFSKEAISGDSVLAVILNMLGIVGLVYFFWIYGLFQDVLRLIKKNIRFTPVFSLLVIILANSIFQEEGFSPYLFGLFSFVLGALVFRSSE